MADQGRTVGRIMVSDEFNRRISIALLVLFGIPAFLLLIMSASANGEDCGSVLTHGERIFLSSVTERACEDAVSGRRNVVMILVVVGVAAQIARSVLIDVAPADAPSSDAVDEG